MMSNQSSPTREELTEAFLRFEKVSEALANAYDDFNAQIESFQSRVDQLSEKERVALRLRGVLDILPCGIIILDKSGIIEDCNPVAKKLLMEELVSRSWNDVMKTCFSPRVDDGYEVSTKNNLRLSIATQALTGGDGQLIVITDLTETRALQKRLSRDERLSDMGKMTAQLAHQIRTPLAAGILYASHLASGKLEGDKVKTFSVKLLARLNELEKQVKDMLLYASGGNTIVVDYPIDKLLNELVASVEVSIQSSNSTLIIENNLDKTLIQCNHESLIGALRNLIDNAIQAVGFKAFIRIVVCRSSSDLIDIIVIDQGPGIAKEIQDQVTEPFFTTRSRGTGLGLAVAKAVAKAHYGNLWIESEEGKGTRVGIRLPNQRVIDRSQVHSEEGIEL